MSCSSLGKNCSECSALFGCHWCGYGSNTGAGCFPIGDAVNGCFWGASCSSCVRSESEFIGYASSWPYIVAAFVALSTLFLSFICLSFLISAFLKPANTQEDTGYVEMASLGPVDPDITIGELYSVDTEFSLLPQRTYSTSVWAFMKKVWHLLLLFIITSLTVMIILLAVISPHEPEFSVCNKSVDWASLLNTISKIPSSGVKFRGRFNLIVSFYNPNKFELSLEECSGDFYYKDSMIGSYSFHGASINQTFYVAGGSVNDLLLVAELQVAISDIPSLAADWARNQVFLKMYSQATVGIVAASTVQYSRKYFLPQVDLDLSQVDNTHCKCK